MNSRAKGKRGELRAVHFLRRWYPDARRSANQSGGADQPDVEGTPYWVEVKEGKLPRVWAAIDQADRDRTRAGDDRPILVVAHSTRGRTIVVMLAEEFGEECLDR